MLKFRTMVVDAESVGGSSTSARDPRITSIGHLLRRWKLDEIPQFINVLKGDMSLVGPRPQVGWDVARYTEEERRLLTVRPGITDWASIRFRDEGEILAAEADPDEAYDRLIRPDKIRLGLEYVDKVSVRTDLQILRDTFLSVIGRTPRVPGEAKGRRFSDITEDWQTAADDQQWELSSQRYSTAAALGRDKVLAEVGCGTGYGLSLVAPFTKSAIGIDIDERNIAIARDRAPQCDFIIGTADDLPFADGALDCLVALEMVYYLSDQVAFFNEAARALTPGGTLLVTMPNPLRKAFQPSPLSTHYPTSSGLVNLLSENGFETELFGSCPVAATASHGKEALRRALVGLHLIPRTIKGRERMKRVVSRKMRKLETIRVDPAHGYDNLVRLEDPTEAVDYAVVVAVGTRKP